jgi:hypothetical protein
MVDEEDIKNLYTSDQYIKDNPKLFEKDTHFKVKNIIPLVDIFLENINKTDINLLDVGGGSGLILKEVSDYINESYGINVNKFVMDLSPGMIKKQYESNSDIKKSLNEDICKSSLNDNEIDLTLMIDVLEHVIDPIAALTELKRISNFVLFKVPLENNLHFNIMNFVTKGKTKEENAKCGHINIYSFKELKYQIETYYGNLRAYYFTNIFKEVLERKKTSSEENIGLMNLIIYFVASKLFYVSPKLVSSISTDYLMVLV